MSRVFIAQADDYQPGPLQAALSRALQRFPHVGGRHMAAKANWVFADRKLADACYTRPEVVHAALNAIFARRPDGHLTFIGNSGAGMPTAVAARRACGTAPTFQRRGYWEFERLYPGKVRLEPTDEGRLARFTLSCGPRMGVDARHDWRIDPGPHARYWRHIKTSALLGECDTLIFFPKLKSNILSNGLTGACKLGGIGLLLDEDRMDGHNFHNDRRIADMLEIARPDLIITDAIDVAFGGNQMTQRPHRLGVIIVADNPVAHDVVACHLFGLDPRQVGHLRLAGERGWGPLDLADIEIESEVPLEELRARVAAFGHHGGIEVADFPRKFHDETGWDFPFEVVSGPPYEHAGSQGVLLDWFYMSYDHADRRRGMAAWPRAAALVGEFDRLPSDRNATIYVIGRRASERFAQAAEIARRVDVPRWLRDTFAGPHAFARYRRPDGGCGLAVLFEGDPPTHRDLILGFFVASRGRMMAPLFRLDLIYDSYVRMLGTQLRRRLRNRGPMPRIEARDIVRMQAWRSLLDRATA